VRNQVITITANFKEAKKKHAPWWVRDGRAKSKVFKVKQASKQRRLSTSKFDDHTNA
jgi:hypothetical protein